MAAVNSGLGSGQHAALCEVRLGGRPTQRSG